VTIISLFGFVWAVFFYLYLCLIHFSTHFSTGNPHQNVFFWLALAPKKKNVFENNSILFGFLCWEFFSGEHLNSRLRVSRSIWEILGIRKYGVSAAAKRTVWANGTKCELDPQRRLPWPRRLPSNKTKRRNMFAAVAALLTASNRANSGFDATYALFIFNI